MRFASVLHDGQPYAVAIEDQTAVPLIDVAELGAQAPNDLLRDAPLDRDAAFPLSEATFRPLVPRPEKIICVGLNYKAHIEETQREDSAVLHQLRSAFHHQLVAYLSLNNMQSGKRDTHLHVKLLGRSTMELRDWLDQIDRGGWISDH